MKKLILVVVLFSQSYVLADDSNEFGGISNIKSGNTEISLIGDLGYSTFSGINADIDLYARYFFWDNLSIGIKGGLYKSEVTTVKKYGLSTKWYFAEVGRWAFSYSQDIYRSEVESYWVGSYKTWRGSSRLGANYFINNNFSIFLGGESDYSLEHLTLESVAPISPKVGITVNF